MVEFFLFKSVTEPMHGIFCKVLAMNFGYDDEMCADPDDHCEKCVFTDPIIFLKGQSHEIFGIRFFHKSAPPSRIT